MRKAINTHMVTVITMIVLMLMVMVMVIKHILLDDDIDDGDGLC